MLASLNSVSVFSLQNHYGSTDMLVLDKVLMRRNEPCIQLKGLKAGKSSQTVSALLPYKFMNSSVTHLLIQDFK